jgi:hypothetical protein
MWRFEESILVDGLGVPVSDWVVILIEKMLEAEVWNRFDIVQVARCPWLLDQETWAKLEVTVFKENTIF